jgi:release factor glutamine methyltransferase
MTVQELIRELSEKLAAAKIESPRLTAELILSGVLARKRLEMLAAAHAHLTAPQLKRARQMAARRVKGEPLQYILGAVDFCGCEIAVDPRALIPRPETELLVETVALKLRSRPRAPHDALRILDLGTGSGCIAAALARQFPSARIMATDVSLDALALARENARRNRVSHSIEFHCGDLFEAVPVGAAFDAIVSNPPYVAESAFSALAREIREHEPRGALVAGASGLEALEKIIRQARDFLLCSGLLALEIGFDQREQVERLLNKFNFREIEFVRDLQGHSRVAVARFH